MRKILFFLLTFTLVLTSCGEYNKILKSTDYDIKYSYAKKYFNMEKYDRSATLLEELVSLFKGTDKAEESLFLLAQSYYGQEDYGTASEYFKTYYETYPKGRFAELSRYYSGYGLYLQSPDPRLDQSKSYEAIQQLQLYLEYYPQSQRAKDAQNSMFELQEKLAQKEFNAAKLYYNLGTYMGNNFLSSIVTSKAALKDYPYTKLREDFMFLIISARYQMAKVSVDKKLQGRYRDVVDEYYNYTNEFPEGKHIEDVQKYYDYCKDHIHEVY
ncbi:MAG: outer membrane protein assembly factor BamD [Massilibacteroides sp.]|nr:outer membrane protein assembly factor BamD [Massilibacteroides sp.]